MDSGDGSNITDPDQPVISLVKVKIAAAEAPVLLKEAIDLLPVEKSNLPGFLSAQVLLSVEGTTLIVMSEWRNRHAWAQSRYDVRLGKLIDDWLMRSVAIEFELYTRRIEVGMTSAT